MWRKLFQHQKEIFISKKICTEYEDDYAYQNNGAPLLIYDIEVRANGLEYDIEIDAVTGKVLKVEIDS